MAKTSAQIYQEFLDTFSDNMADPAKMDKLGVGFKAFMDAQKLIVADDGLAVYDPTKPYGLMWNQIEDTYYRYGHTIPTIQQQMRRVVCNGNPMFGGTVFRYLDKDDSALFEDGTDATSYVTGAEGGNYQVFVEIPKHYVRDYANGSLQYNIVSLTKFDGGVTDKSFRKSGWTDSGDGTDADNESSYAYISAFEGVRYDDGTGLLVDGTGSTPTLDLVNDKILSVSGYKPETNITRDQSRQMIANGSSKQFDWHRYSLMRRLFIIEYGTNDSQSAIPGYTENASGASYANDVMRTGLTLSLGNNSGSISGLDQFEAGGGDAGGFSGVVANSYRGIENFYGHLWQWVDAVNITNGQPFVNDIFGVFADDVYTGEYIRAKDSDGKDITNPLSSGYQSTLNSGSFFPKTIGSNSNSKITDNHYYASGNRVLSSGGSLAGSSGAGVSCLYGYNSSSIVSWNVCCRA